MSRASFAKSCIYYFWCIHAHMICFVSAINLTRSGGDLVGSFSCRKVRVTDGAYSLLPSSWNFVLEHL